MRVLKQRHDSPDRQPHEINLLRYPVAVLARRAVHTTRSLRFQEAGPDGRLRRWVVQRPADDSKFPGPFEFKVLRTVEAFLLSLLPNLPQLVQLPSLGAICRWIGISSEGRGPGRVAEALKRLSGLTIDQEWAWFDKAKRDWHHADRFHLFSVHLRGEGLPTGGVSDGVFLYLHPLYWNSLKLQYVRYLDWPLYRSLGSTVTQRLYEILTLRFATLQHSAYATVLYLELCDQIPLTPKRHLSQARQQLDPHHRRLIETAFLSQVEWRTISGGWLLLYWPGPRAGKGTDEAIGPQPQNSLTALVERPTPRTGDRSRQEAPRTQGTPDRPPYLPRNLPLDDPVCQVLSRFADRWQALSGQALDVTIPRAIKEVRTRLQTTPLPDLLRLVELWFDPGLAWVAEAERGCFHTFMSTRAISELKGLNAGLSDERPGRLTRLGPRPPRRPREDEDARYWEEGVPAYLLFPEQRSGKEGHHGS